MSFQKPGLYSMACGRQAEVIGERDGRLYGRMQRNVGGWVPAMWEPLGTHHGSPANNLVSEWTDAPDPGPGWRLLEECEEVQEGDETFNCGDREWSAEVTALVGKTAGHWAKKYPLHGPVFRRRVTPWTPTCELRWAPAKAGWREELQQKWTRGSETEWRPVQVAE